MADMMDTLKDLLGDNAEEKLSGIMKILNPDDSQTTPEILTQTQESATQKTDAGAITPEMLMAAQAMLSKLSAAEDDDRSKLLMSLRPYMRKSRQSSIDSAIKMLNLAQMSQFFKGVI